MSAVKTILRTIQNPDRTAGILLISSFLILLIALIILVTSRAIPGFTAMLQGSLAQVAPYNATFRLLILLFILGWIVQLLGIGLFARLLARAGSEQLAILGFALILVTTIIAILYYSFRTSVELWAAGEAARTGNLPNFYEPLREWLSSAFRVAYSAHFIAVAGLGLGILRARLLAPWVGQLTIGWSLLWLLGSLVGMGAPAIPLIMPIVIGFALLMKSSEKSV